MEETKSPVVTQPAKQEPKKVAPKAPTIIKDLKHDMPKPLTTQELRAQKTEESRLRLRREWEVESKMVTGVFRDLEVGAGGNLRFSARKYPWDSIENYDFKDGHTYTVPLWVAKHLNENCKWPVYKHNIDPNAKEGEKAKQYVNQWNHRFAFISSDYIGLITPQAPPIVVGNME